MQNRISIAFVEFVLKNSIIERLSSVRHFFQCVLRTEVLGGRVLPWSVRSKRQLVPISTQVEFEIELSLVMAIHKMDQFVCCTP